MPKLELLPATSSWKAEDIGLCIDARNAGLLQEGQLYRIYEVTGCSCGTRLVIHRSFGDPCAETFIASLVRPNNVKCSYFAKRFIKIDPKAQEIEDIEELPEYKYMRARQQIVHGDPTHTRFTSERNIKNFLAWIWQTNS